MTTRYINGTYIAAGYTVASGVTELIITPSGAVGGDGILASSFLTIFNEGVVIDHVMGGDGLDLQGGGVVFNGSATYTNATIKGSIGIQITAAIGYVVNHGTIEGASSAYGARGDGVALYLGGTVINGAFNSRNALIEGGNSGVLITGAGARVNNYGTIGSSYGQGVYLAGGVVTNGASGDGAALIEGALQGVTVRSDAGAVVNYGTIEGQSGGILFYKGGIVTNGSGPSPGALITGDYGVSIDGSAGTVANFGTIKGLDLNEAAVTLSAGGSVANGSSGDSAALISGAQGVAISGGASTVTNFGTIKGLSRFAAAVTLAAGGVVTNGLSGDAGALISGVQGVSIGGTAAGTVTNYGSIIGWSGAYEAGVAINGAGSVFNGATGLIEGGEGAGLAGGGLVRNLGTIRGEANYGPGGAGVLLAQGGQVTNGFGSDRTALIQGAQGVIVQNTAGFVMNSGTILGEGSGFGVELLAGGSVTNGLGRNHVALIEGYSGLYLNGANATNNGTIAATGDYGVGVKINGSALLDNNATYRARATIDGWYGVMCGANSTAFVQNYGTIEGDGGMAVDFLSNTDTLGVGAGSTFLGEVLGGGGTLDLVNGTGTIALGAAETVTVSGSMAPTTFQQFGTVEVAASAVFTLGGNATLVAGQTLVSAGMLTASASVTNGGVLESLGGTLVISGAVTGSGKAVINGGMLDFASGFNQSVTFVNNGTLQLSQSQTFTASVSGFSKTGATSLDLVDIGFVSSTEATFSGTTKGGVLTVTDGTHTAKINLKGNYLGSTWIASSDGHGGTTVVDPRAKSGASPLALAAAMAAIAPASAPAGTQTAEPWRSTTTPLIAPRGG